MKRSINEITNMELLALAMENGLIDAEHKDYSTLKMLVSLDYEQLFMLLQVALYSESSVIIGKNDYRFTTSAAPVDPYLGRTVAPAPAAPIGAPAPAAAASSYQSTSPIMNSTVLNNHEAFMARKSSGFEQRQAHLVNEVFKNTYSTFNGKIPDAHDVGLIKVLVGRKLVVITVDGGYEKACLTRFGYEVFKMAAIRGVYHE